MLSDLPGGIETERSRVASPPRLRHPSSRPGETASRQREGLVHQLLLLLLVRAERAHCWTRARIPTRINDRPIVKEPPQLRLDVAPRPHILGFLLAPDDRLHLGEFSH